MEILELLVRRFVHQAVETLLEHGKSRIGMKPKNKRLSTSPGNSLLSSVFLQFLSRRAVCSQVGSDKHSSEVLARATENLAASVGQVEVVVATVVTVDGNPSPPQLKWKRGQAGVGKRKVHCQSVIIIPGTFLFQNVIGLSGSLAGYLLFIGQTADAACTPLVGYFSDRSAGCYRFGRRKCWHAVGT